MAARREGITRKDDQNGNRQRERIKATFELAALDKRNTLGMPTGMRWWVIMLEGEAHLWPVLPHFEHGAWCPERDRPEFMMRGRVYTGTNDGLQWTVVAKKDSTLAVASHGKAAHTPEWATGLAAPVRTEPEIEGRLRMRVCRRQLESPTSSSPHTLRLRVLVGTTTLNQVAALYPSYGHGGMAIGPKPGKEVV